MGEENRTILEGIRIIRGGTRLHPRRGCERYVEDGYISCRGEDVSNVMRRAPSCMEEMVKAMRDGIALLYVGDLRRRKAPSHVVEVMRVMWWEELHPTSWRGWEQCAATPNWWLIGVEVARSIDDYEGCFLSRPRSLGRMPSDPILQAVCLQVLSFRLYAFRFSLPNAVLFFLMPPDLSSSSTWWVTPPSFTRFHSMGYATKFHHYPDAESATSPKSRI